MNFCRTWDSMRKMKEYDMVNTQKAEPHVLNSNNGVLDVQGEPWLTIQGEGPFVGIPAIFIRLAGCNIQCPGCDTDYTSDRHMMTVQNLLSNVCRLASPPECRLAVITGGEPFRQPIWDLITELIHHGFRVQVETNGTIFRRDVMPQHPWVSIVCSPKTAKIHPDIRPNAFKYVLNWLNVDPDDGLPTTTLMNEGKVYRPPNLSEYMDRNAVYVQPMDAGISPDNELNLKAAIDSCLKFGYRLCLQTHKIVGLP